MTVQVLNLEAAIAQHLGGQCTDPSRFDRRAPIPLVQQRDQDGERRPFDSVDMHLTLNGKVAEVATFTNAVLRGNTIGKKGDTAVSEKVKNAAAPPKDGLRSSVPKVHP